MTRIPSFFLLAIITLGVFSGCARDFEPYWRVDKLRLMAIKADPVVAKQFEPVILSALVYAPDNAEIRYSWSWCPLRISAQDDYECPLDEEEFGDFPLDLDLGTEPTATFVNPFSAEEVRQFCEAIAAFLLEELDDPELAGLLPDFKCDQGYEISVRLQVETDEESLVAAKRLTLWGGSEQYNKNPELIDFQIRPREPEDLQLLLDQAGWELPANADPDDHDDQWLSLSGDSGEEPLAILTGTPFEIRALVDPESVQTFLVAPPIGQESQGPQEREEALVFRYFTTLGTFAGSRRLYSPIHQELDEAPITELSVSENQFTERCPEATDEDCLLQLWSVVRDGRLGVDWIERSLLVLEAQ